ncbi:siderophore-interacting protein [Rhodococcus cerastii]|nr:siderophore-interacting protein [Rhodococcus cerastii]
MVMTVASIAEVEQRTDDTVRVVLQSSEFGNLSVRGAAPVFKLFVPRVPADEMMLPTLGSDKLAVPSWEADPRRPIGRSYTAIDFNPGDRRITFDVIDLGKPDWWLNRTGVGSRVGVIGFKHELVLVPGVTDVVAVGDRSARPAVGSLTNLAEQVRIHSFTAPSGEHGFPDIEWVDIVDRTKAQTESTMLWIGGEKSCVARLRNQAIENGLPPSRIVALPYWSAGRTRDEFDHALYRLYQRAAADGIDISDPVVAADIELQ